MKNKIDLIQKKIDVVPVVLCGGSGTRLWPLSRIGYPKQFLTLNGGLTLYQQASIRIANIQDSEISVLSPLIITGEEHRFLAADQLKEINIEIGKVILEPSGRNTAPALTLAALAAICNGLDPILVVTPADQAVIDENKFKHSIQKAIHEATSGAVLVLGIKPDRPETGYGYIQVDGDGVVPEVINFFEKPDIEIAKKYFDNECFFWNAGIFILKASVWLKAIGLFRQDILEATKSAWSERSEDGIFIRPDLEKFNLIPTESIDYAVMEKIPNSGLQIKMVQLKSGWSDLGAWDSVFKILPKDSNGNAQVGDVYISECKNTLVNASSRLVTILGVKDLLVIESADAVLVADIRDSQNVKNIVEKLKSNKRVEVKLHRKVHRPWGWYDTLEEGMNFKVKLIHVKPGASLSMQKHNHRSEHWVIVKGTADIINGEQKIQLIENQSTYIPIGSIHRLTNNSTTFLEVIEVQTGIYLGEDDIVRIEDKYGRIL